MGRPETGKFEVKPIKMWKLSSKEFRAFGCHPSSSNKCEHEALLPQRAQRVYRA